MFNQKLIPPILTSIVFLLILLWAYTASSKIMEYEKFIFQMKLVPITLISDSAVLLAWIVPITELALVVLLLRDTWRYYGMLFSMLLLFAFNIYILILLLSNLHLPCTCGGIISSMGWKTHLVFNTVFMILCLIYLKHYSNNKPTKHIRRIVRNGYINHQIFSLWKKT